MAVIVLAAFLASGGLKAGTPLAIASTPVSATEPPAKALSRSRMPTASVPNGTASGRGAAVTTSPVRMRKKPMATIAQGQEHEQVGRDREDVAGLAQAAQVGDGDERDRDERDLDAVVVGGRDDRLDLGDRRGRRHRDRHHVVDEQGGRRHEPGDRRQVRAGHDVRAATVRIGAAHLAVRHRDDGQQQRDGDRHLDRQEHRARAREHQHAQDLLGRVGRGADRVRAEDGQRLALGEALADLLLGRQRASEDDRADAGGQPGARGQRGARGGLGDQLPGAA